MSHSLDPTYYDRPLLKEPAWKWVIPLYYYVGGLTGASLALCAAAQLTHDHRFENLIRRCHTVGLLGTTVSGALLIYDLGRPERFHHMLRVFRPTSPMNVGAWILLSAGAGTTGAIALQKFSPPAASCLGLASGLSGVALATYTGVLVANSAIPLWQESRKVLPVLFGASAMASVGSACDMFAANAAERRATVTFGNIGRTAEIVAAIIMEKQASAMQRIGLPLKHGRSGFLWKTAGLLTGTSLLFSLLRPRGRGKQIAAGVFGTLGSLLMRYAVHHAGVISARDARASFHQQRPHNK
jgi:formate-dependent nitrite reductase membrane component NrfD